VLFRSGKPSHFFVIFVEVIRLTRFSDFLYRLSKDKLIRIKGVRAQEGYFRGDNKDVGGKGTGS